MTVAQIDSSSVWALVGAAVTAVGAVIVQIIMARHKVSQEERQTLNSEWKELAERQEARIDELQHRYQAEIVALQARTEKLEKEKEDCHRENSELRTRVAVLELRLGMTPGQGK
jgi:uncharacterized protein YlxW (UPF0749 family)